MKVFEEKLWVSLGVLLFIGVVLLTLIISTNYAVDTEYSIAYRKNDGLKRNLAWIDCDPYLDDPSFTLCNEHAVRAYYRGRPQYHEDGQSIEDLIVQEFSDCPVIPELNGYLTVRFMVNCEGDVGRYRTYALDLDFQPALYPEIQRRLLEYMMNLKRWRPYTQEGRSYDTISHLHCKIDNGIITHVSR